MGNLDIILAVAAMLILVGGLLYTLKAGKLVSSRQSEYDSEINEKTQNHPIFLNPVVLAYIIGIGLVILFIIYQGFNFY
jgi:predicted permease